MPIDFFKYEKSVHAVKEFGLCNDGEQRPACLSYNSIKQAGTKNDAKKCDVILYTKDKKVICFIELKYARKGKWESS